MFARIMAVVLTVILLLTAVLSGIGWIALQNQQTQTVMETLRTEAREIAYLAAQRRTSLSFFDRADTSQQQYIRWKAAEIYDEYGAYILGRMGIPHCERGINLISVAVDAPQSVISALSGKIGRLPGVSAKTAYAGSNV